MDELPLYPASDLDRPGRYRAALGGFWDRVYDDGGAVTDLLAARLLLQRQAFSDLDALQAAVSRLSCPVFRTRLWAPLTLAAADRLGPGSRYDDGGRFDAGAVYDGRGGPGRFAWPLPADLARLPVLCNRTHAAGLVWCEGVDYSVRYDPRGNVVEFVRDPFARDDLAGDGDSVTLWAYRPAYDERTFQDQHGYVFGLDALPSTDRAKRAANAVADAAVEGSTVRALCELAAAATDSPAALEDGEVVEAVLRGPHALWVVTDRRAYRAGVHATAVVSAGDVLEAARPLTDAFELSDFRRGRGWQGLRALSLGRGPLDGGYLGPLGFRNAATPWVVEEGVGGHTKVSFALDGRPEDAAAFWADVHARGVAAGKTLAHLLDLRDRPEGEPPAASLPATVNPLKFLAENVLRNNYGVLRLRPRSFGPDAAPPALRLLRKLVPPGSALLVASDYAAADTLPGDFAGDENGPGVAESPGLTTNLLLTETAGPGMLRERVRLVNPGAACD